MYPMTFVVVILSSFCITAVSSQTLFECQVCQDFGRDCKGEVKTGCDYCSKVIGVLRNPSQIPDIIKPLIDPNFLKKGQPSDSVNKTIVIKMCASKALLSLVGNAALQKVGCKTASMFGVVGRGCLCQGNCIYPKKICQSDNDLECVEAIERDQQNGQKR